MPARLTPEEAAARLDAKNWRKHRNATYRAMGDRLLEVTQEEAPRGEGEGEHLADHLRAVISTTDRPIRITADSPEMLQRLGWVVGGTPPHMIVATNATALHWVEGGVDFFAKSVQHPGTAPNDFLSRAADKAAPDLEELLHDAAVAWFDEVASG